ncbi:MAG: hypothetical protein ABI380_11205, partial [Edaphobacter sp.]
AVRVAADGVFAERATHAFPPTVQIAAKWQPELEVLAKELGYPCCMLNVLQPQSGAGKRFPLWQ